MPTPIRRRALLRAAAALPALTAVPWVAGSQASSSSPARAPSALPSVSVLPPLAMPGLDRMRTLRLCLPPSYARDTGRRYPVVYMHDGQNLFDDATSYAGEWGVDETMAALAQASGFEAIVVGIDNGAERRMTELNPWDHERFGAGEGRAYLRFLVDVVKPFVDARWRTLPGRDHTAVIGSSMGGLISHAALLMHPQVFGRAGVVSPAYWTAPPVFDLAAATPLPAPARVLLTMGTGEGERALKDVRRMHTLLQPAWGERVALREFDGAPHNEGAWRTQLPGVLRWLFEIG